MKIVLFAHPSFFSSRSMPRFASMIRQGMASRRHTVDVWMPPPNLHRLRLGSGIKKWLGYADQYVIFPQQIRSGLGRLSKETVFVFADQALGIWVPLVADRPHVIHVHDFMALRSALGEYPENPTKWTGRCYQALIRRGFGRGRHFISVSENTRSELHRFLPTRPALSEVAYNGLHYDFRPIEEAESAASFASVGLHLPSSGYLLHVGGNSWYKNRIGVLEIYEAYVRSVSLPLPLMMIGAPLDGDMKSIARRCEPKGQVLELTGLPDEQVCAAYSSARLLLFPSIAEGFGWPIAEAMACGCPVLTTAAAPMTEVGGDVAFYAPRRPIQSLGWAAQVADQVVAILGQSAEQRKARRDLGLQHAKRFDAEHALDAYERIYQQVSDAAQMSRQL